MSKTKQPERQIWNNMIRRCEDETAVSYHRYGGRGILVCARWRESFDAFLADMGPRPSSQYSIDRINNDGHYEPGNCRWATRRQQVINKSPHVLTLNAFALDEEGVALLDELMERSAICDVNQAVRYAIGKFLDYEKRQVAIARAEGAMRRIRFLLGELYDAVNFEEDEEPGDSEDLEPANDDAA